MDPDTVETYATIITQVAALVKAMGASGCFVLVDSDSRVRFKHIVGDPGTLPFDPYVFALDKAMQATHHGIPTAKLVEDPALRGNPTIADEPTWAGGTPIRGGGNRVIGGLAFSGLGQWTDQALVDMVIHLYRSQLRDAHEQAQAQALAAE